MKSMIFSLVLTAVLLGANPAPSLAAGPYEPPAPVEQPKIAWNTKASGLPRIVLTWPDGREARSEIQGPLTYTYKSRIDVTENLCQLSSQKAGCDVTAHIHMANLQIRWSKHPNPARVGQALRYNYGGGGGGGFQTFQAEAIGGVPRGLGFAEPGGVFDDFPALASQLRCDGYDWLGSDPLRRERIDFIAIHHERMDFNNETGVAENRIVGTQENVRFLYSPISKSYETVFEPDTSPFILALGTTLSLFRRGADGEPCQISASHDVLAISRQYNEYMAHLQKTPYAPFVGDSAQPGFEFLVKFQFTTTQYGEYQ